MDQGLAAVLGAAVGVLGAAITGSLGYLAARQQATDQGRIEHARQLRAERRETYLALMKLMEPAKGFMNTEPSQMSGQYYAAAYEQLHEAQKNLYLLLPQVELCGPPEISEAARKVWGWMYELEIAVEILLAGRGPQKKCLAARCDDYDAAQVQFIELARSIMTQAPK